MRTNRNQIVFEEFSGVFSCLKMLGRKGFFCHFLVVLDVEFELHNQNEL